MADRSPDTGPDDPIKSSSFALPLLIASFLLILTVAWSFYVEFYGLQPWRGYQSRFAKAYSTFLRGKSQGSKRRAKTRFIPPSEYKALASKSRRSRKSRQSSRRRYRQANRAPR